MLMHCNGNILLAENNYLNLGKGEMVFGYPRQDLETKTHATRQEKAMDDLGTAFRATIELMASNMN